MLKNDFYIAGQLLKNEHNVVIHPLFEIAEFVEYFSQGALTVEVLLRLLLQ